MPNLRNLLLAAGCTAILGASAGYAEDLHLDAVQRWREHQEQSLREWREKQEQTLEAWKRNQEEQMKREREAWEKREQALKEWRETQEERTKQRKETWTEQDRQIREFGEERDRQIKEFNQERSRQVNALLERRARQREEFLSGSPYAKPRVKSEPEEKPQKSSTKAASTLDTEKKKFADTITEKNSYASLVNQLELAELFSRYSHLKGTGALPATRIKTSVTDPQTLDDILEKINDAVENLPQNYAGMMKSTQVKLYIAATKEELSQKCRLKSTGGCYLPQEHTIYVRVESGSDAYTETIPHELAHARYEKLPAPIKKKLTKAIKAIVYRRGIQKDVVKDKDGYVTSWKDGLTLPRYALVTPRAASNVDELLAETIEDLYAKKSRNVALILRGEYRQDAVKALEAMKEAGFLGTAEEAYVTIGKVLEKAGR